MNHLAPDEEERYSISSGGTSPALASASDFDINYFLSLASSDGSNNVGDLTSGSSSIDSRSQGSRELTPADWPMANGGGDANVYWEQQSTNHYESNHQMKWNLDPNVAYSGSDAQSHPFMSPAISASVDPSTLTLGNTHHQQPAIFDQTAYSFQQGQPHDGGLTSAPVFDFSRAMPPRQPQPTARDAQAFYVPKTSQQHLGLPDAPPIQTLQSEPPSAAEGADPDLIGRRARELAGISYAIPVSSANGSHDDAAHARIPPEILRMQMHIHNGGTPQDFRPQAPVHVMHDGHVKQEVLYPPYQNISQNYPSPSTASSSDAPGTPPLGQPVITVQMTQGAPKAKNSHTTIERRYRTNLNARLVALRHAVPALRILEKDKFPDEQTDERGYCDGVKAARKASKGSILGKASEYIGVLKRRELRLKREYDGLKALISGLVGGPALLASWEHEWHETHGGEETDELHTPGTDDGEDGDNDDEDDDDEEKPKKKARVTTVNVTPSVVAPVVGANAMMNVNGTEKRKRGRPPKSAKLATTQQPTVTAAFPQTQNAGHVPTHLVPVPVSQGAPGGRYLLGVFLLFSFFNPPAPSHSRGSNLTESEGMLTKRSHVGHVLTSLSSHPAAQYASSTISSYGVPVERYGFEDFLQHAHLVISALLFVSVIFSLYPSLARIVPFGIGEWFLSPSQRLSSLPKRERSVDEQVLKAALAEDDRDKLAATLKLSSIGPSDWLSACIRAFLRFLRVDRIIRFTKVNALERTGLIRLAELEVVDDSISLLRRSYFALRMIDVLSHSASTEELVTRAFTIRPFSSELAARYWSRAKSAQATRAPSALLMRSFDSALKLYASGAKILGPGAIASRTTPLGIVAVGYVCEEIKTASAKLFVKESFALDVQDGDVPSLGRAVSAGSVDSESENDADETRSRSHRTDMADVVALGRRLPKAVADLTQLWVDVSSGLSQPTSARVSFVLPSSFSHRGRRQARNEDAEEYEGEAEEDSLTEATSFLEAISLYRRIASSAPVTQSGRLADGRKRDDGEGSPTPSETSTLFAPPVSDAALEHVETSSSSFSSSTTPTVSDTESELVSQSYLASAMRPKLQRGSTSNRAYGKAGVGSRLTLRQMLAGGAFGASSDVADARDRVVDWLVDTDWY